MLSVLKHIDKACRSFFDRINTNFFSKLRTSKLLKYFLFFAAVFLVFYYIGLFKHLKERPAYVHISAQCQRASIALNYYQNDMNFFEPRIQRYEKGEGITGVEFPIIYYMAAIMYKLFGFHEIYLKLISLIIVLLGLFYFFKTANEFVKNNVLAVMTTIAVCLSPVFLVYTPNFMPDAPSLGLQLIAWYFFFKFIRTKTNKHLNLFIFFAVLAILIKAIAIIVFVIVLCLVVLDKLHFFKPKFEGFLFKSHSQLLKAVGIGFVVSISWYLYASWLSKHYDNESFALKPIMINSWEAFDKVVEFVVNLWMQYYYAYEGYVLLISMFVLMILFIRNANRLLLSITILNLIGSCFYIFFFLNQFRDHDYYMIAIMPTFFFLILTVSEMIVRFAHKHFILLEYGFIIVLFFNMKESVTYCKKMYSLRNSHDIFYWTGDYRAYEDLEPKLRNAGIKRTDKFISAFDDSYCSSLYLMDQIGVTVMGWNTKEDVQRYIQNPEMKYLILNDSARFNKLYPNDFHNKVFLHHRGLIIYKLRN
jgi:hypothetical protein